MKLTNTELNEFIEMERAIVSGNEQSENVNVVTVKFLSALEELKGKRDSLRWRITSEEPIGYETNAIQLTHGEFITYAVREQDGNVWFTLGGGAINHADIVKRYKYWRPQQTDLPENNYETKANTTKKN